ncbi:MAG: FHA domain-containing protein, partial [Bryobacterales bacterium]|nr:FHA domain-containing protein [Bryobacterales bacterium]
MDEFEQLFQQAAAPQAPLAVTTDVPGQDAAVLEAFCQCLAMLASGSRLAPAETLRSGLAAIQNAMWQIQSGLGLAASGMGWVASFTDLPQIGQKLLSLSGGGHQLHLQLDTAERFFAGTWQGGAGTLTFTIDPGAGGSDFHAHLPAEFAIPLGAAASGWIGGPPMPATPASAPAPAAAPRPQQPVAAPPPLPAQSWFLTVRTGALAGKKIALPEMFRIGRGLQSDLVLPDDAASRNHATLEISAAGCIFTDLGATNGSSVNGALIAQPTALKDGDVIVCGTTEMLVNGPPPPAFDVQKTSVLPVMRRPLPQPAQQLTPETTGGFCLHCGKPLTG